jgi:hypothetical protein
VASTTTIVDNGREIHVTANLSSVAEVFSAREPDPFDENMRTTAVVDDIACHLRVRSLRPPPAIVLSLTLHAAQIEGDLARRVQAALRRYAARKLSALERARAATRFEAYARLPAGIAAVAAVLAVMLVLIGLFPESVKTYLVALLTPFATVAVWVALWNPLEMLLYDGWTLRRDRAIYALLGNIEVAVQRR